jgi:DNA-binding winged helix-turn-helix (wHTH) protein
MTAHDPLLLESGDLSVCPHRGEVRNARGEATRLGPVNMKVLALLMSRAGQVVGRAEIFATVWRNQLIGDDVLTRAISDIRAELARLSGHEGLIETVPKRGYRWTAEVRRAAAGASTDAPLASPVPVVHGDDAAKHGDRRAAPRRNRLLVFAGRGLLYAAALVLLASAGVWLMDQLARPGPPVVAVLPIVAAPEQRERAARIERDLADHLLRLDSVDLLARSAVESRPSNPFPYFYYEFGASWLVEAKLEHLSPGTVLTLDVVDARTGIVLLQSTAPVGVSPAALDVESVARPLAEFFESQQRSRR